MGQVDLKTLGCEVFDYLSAQIPGAIQEKDISHGNLAFSSGCGTGPSIFYYTNEGGKVFEEGFKYLPPFRRGKVYSADCSMILRTLHEPNLAGSNPTRISEE
jgi:hypothetical protein